MRINYINKRSFVVTTRILRHSTSFELKADLNHRSRVNISFLTLPWMTNQRLLRKITLVKGTQCFVKYIQYFASTSLDFLFFQHFLSNYLSQFKCGITSFFFKNSILWISFVMVRFLEKSLRRQCGIIAPLKTCHWTPLTPDLRTTNSRTEFIFHNSFHLYVSKRQLRTFFHNLYSEEVYFLLLKQPRCTGIQERVLWVRQKWILKSCQCSVYLVFEVFSQQNTVMTETGAVHCFKFRVEYVIKIFWSVSKLPPHKLHVLEIMLFYYGKEQP